MKIAFDAPRSILVAMALVAACGRDGAGGVYLLVELESGSPRPESLALTWTDAAGTPLLERTVTPRPGDGARLASVRVAVPGNEPRERVAIVRGSVAAGETGAGVVEGRIGVTTEPGVWIEVVVVLRATAPPDGGAPDAPGDARVPDGPIDAGATPDAAVDARAPTEVATEDAQPDGPTDATDARAADGAAPPADAAPVLFQDDFESGTATAWTPVAGRWAPVKDAVGWMYEETTGHTGIALAAWPASAAWTNYEAEADVRLAGIGGGAGAALVFRSQSQTAFYFFEAKSGSGWGLYRTVGGTTTRIGEGGLPFAAGSTLRLRVTAVGDTFTLAARPPGADWKPLGTVKDATLPAGGVGLRTWVTSARFDAVVVTAR